MGEHRSESSLREKTASLSLLGGLEGLGRVGPRGCLRAIRVESMRMLREMPSARATGENSNPAKLLDA